MKQGLVIGANGFLGRHLTVLLIDSGWEVTAGIHTNTEHIPPGVESKSLNHILNEAANYDVVFLLSAAIPYPNRPVSEEQLKNVNMALPGKVSRKFPESRLVYASSVAIYGEHAGVIAENSQPINPNIYGQTKLAGEKEILQHPNSLCVRFSSLYGDGMYADTFIPRAIKQAVNDALISLSGNGSRLQDYLSVKDACGYLLAGARSEFHGSLLGVYGTSYSNTDVAAIIADLAPGCKIKYTGEDKSPSSVYDNRETRRCLGFTPEIALAGGIQELMTLSHKGTFHV